MVVCVAIAEWHAPVFRAGAVQRAVNTLTWVDRAAVVAIARITGTVQAAN